MTIKTLDYIHKMLIAEEEKTKKIYEEARKLHHEYEESDSADEKLVESQAAAADEYMKQCLDAVNALLEFESHEW